MTAPTDVCGLLPHEFGGLLYRAGRKVSFEYCLLAGVNDSPAHAAATSQLVRGIPCMVNLIPYNQARGAFRRPGPDAVRAFRRVLEERRVEVAVRRSFGEEVAAACGQLVTGRREPNRAHGVLTGGKGDRRPPR